MFPTICRATNFDSSTKTSHASVAVVKRVLRFRRPDAVSIVHCDRRFIHRPVEARISE